MNHPAEASTNASPFFGRSMSDDLFSMALEARCKWGLAKAYCPHITNVGGDWYRYVDLKKEANQLATNAGRCYPNETCPHLLADVPLLREAFEHSQRVEVLIATGDWDALGLPTPDRLMEALFAGESAEVCQHSVILDYEIDAVVYTNPYGLKGVLISRSRYLSDVMRAFLSDMARGVKYE
ncbi:hypothetical protein [Burkholderia pseudomallei]|uniref:hypothetical protein n=1 Tax=Burkholderia pseudomallei TaxID=28450 RepID=UPI0011CE785B|nr:hypothetical protein [Burkholderia pseudomallei]